MTDDTSAGAPRILVVEDEPLIALALTDALGAAGYEVAGPAASVSEGLAAVAEAAPDAALLDITLRGGALSFPIAEALDARSIPFIFVTALPRRELPAHLRHHLLLPKPAPPRQVMLALKALLQHRTQTRPL